MLTDTLCPAYRSANDPEYPWTGVILGSAIMALVLVTDQFHRPDGLVGPQSYRVKKRSILVQLQAFTCIYFLIPGMNSYALNNKGIYPRFGRAFLRSGKVTSSMGFRDGVGEYWQPL
jgi:SSS family solute:Na+ symporter